MSSRSPPALRDGRSACYATADVVCQLPCKREYQAIVKGLLYTPTPCPYAGTNLQYSMRWRAVGAQHGTRLAVAAQLASVPPAPLRERSRRTESGTPERQTVAVIDIELMGAFLALGSLGILERHVSAMQTLTSPAPVLSPTVKGKLSSRGPSKRKIATASFPSLHPRHAVSRSVSWIRDLIY